MIVVLEYLVIAAVIGLVVFFLAVLVFGRGEQMAPLPARTSPSELPDGAVTGNDLRAVRFAVGLRGYRMGDVDWTLDRTAEELDRLRAEVRRLGGDPNLLGPDGEPADSRLVATTVGAQAGGATGDAGVGQYAGSGHGSAVDGTGAETAARGAGVPENPDTRQQPAAEPGGTENRPATSEHWRTEGEGGPLGGTDDGEATRPGAPDVNGHTADPAIPAPPDTDQQRW